MDSQDFLQQYNSGRRNFSGLYLLDLNVSRRILKNISLRGATVNLASLEGIRFINSDLRSIFLKQSVLSFCEFINCDLSDANLNQVKMMNDIKFWNTDLSKANLENSICFWNNIRIHEASLYKASLRKANIYSMYISHSNLRYVDLTDCHIKKLVVRSNDFERAILRSVKFREVRGSNNFRFADLKNADMSYCNLQESNLFGANLQQTNLSYANLKGVDLTHAYLDRTNLVGANLKIARGLNMIKIKKVGNFGVKTTKIIEGASLGNTTLPDGTIH
ncbi:Pentapeptide repeat family protein [Geitlerinema sp. FC II]|nr:pentapeptide repeat-containing protein [Geitlerinema sp. CS-897]PPT07536.1 Pentapeptide repeat family protein [Geitlerinema sp. FC II]